MLCNVPSFKMLLLALAATSVAVPSVVQAQSPAPPLRNDILVQLAPGGLGALVINNFAVNTTVKSGLVSLEARDPRCRPSAQTPCEYIINVIRINLGDFVFSGAEARNGSVVNKAPIPVVDDGSGIILPPGTPLITYFEVEGEDQQFEDPSPGGMNLFLDLDAQELTLLGGFAGQVRGVTVDATVFAAGQAPFANLPPTAEAGPNQRVACGPVTLDGRGSSDPNGDIRFYDWYRGDVPLASGAQPQVNLDAGTHTLRLRVTDSYGSVSEDSVRVTVEAASCEPPVRPSLTCVRRAGHRSYVAVFGYENSGNTAREIPVGAENRFDPQPVDRGQPVRFEPGQHAAVVQASFEGSVTWHLAGASVTATSTSTPCPCPDGSTSNRWGFCECARGSVRGPGGQCACPFEGQVRTPEGCRCPPNQSLLPDLRWFKRGDSVWPRHQAPPFPGLRCVPDPH